MPSVDESELSRREFLKTTAAGWIATHFPEGEGGAKSAGPQPTTATRDPAPLHPSSRTWQAYWIWDRESAKEKNIYVLFRKRFRLEQAARSARALVTADSQYKLYLNGKFVGRGPVRSSPPYLFYDEYEVASNLAVGDNVIAAVVHFFGLGNERYLLGKEGFLFEMTLEAGAPRQLRIVSDETWKSLRAEAWDKDSPQECFGLGFNEILDFRRLPRNWTDLKCDDTQWSTPFVIGKPPREPWKYLVARMIPPLAEEPTTPRLVIQAGEVKDTPPSNPRLIGEQMEQEAVLPPETVEIRNPAHLLDSSGEPTTIMTPSPGRSATLVLDFGREVAAMPIVDVEGVDGAEIDIGFSEFLRDGKPAIIRKVGGFAPSNTADRLILHDGRQRWERFFYSGFRYLQLTFRNCQEPVKVRSVGATLINYPYQNRGYFQCSDPLLTRIWEFGRYSTLACTYDVYVDCPWREKAQWVEMVTPLVSYVCFGAREVAEQYLRTLALSQDAEGRFWIPYPSAFNTELPDQTMWWGMHLWQYYLYFGDPETLRDLYPNLVKANAWFEKHVEPPGLLSTEHWETPISFQQKAEHPWVWIDWGLQQTQHKMSPSEKFSQGAALNCIYIRFLEDAARIARVLGREKDASEFEARAQEMRQVINRVYWGEREGFYHEDVKHKFRGDQASILSILYDVAPKERWVRICKTLLNEKFEVGDSSPHFYIFIFDALEKAGLYDLALEAMRVRYGGMLAKGATTLWEVWQPGETESYCHAYSAGPTFSLSSSVLGVRPTGPGFSTFAVRPVPCSLEWAEGSVPAPAGPISVAWRKEPRSSRFNLSLGVPEECRASVQVPSLPGAKGTLRALDTVVFREGRKASAIKGLESVTRTREGFELTAVPGHYVFVSE